MRSTYRTGTRLAPVRLAGSSTEVAEENSDRDDVAANRTDEKRGMELGFCARCDHRRPSVSLFDGLTVKDEATRLCVAITVARSFSHECVIEVLTWLIMLYGRPAYIRSDNGPELIAQALTTFFAEQGITPSRITPGKPWQNGSNESFNGTFRRGCLDAEQFHSLTEARVVIEDWRQQYNQDRPHSALGYQTPATVYWGYATRKTAAADCSNVEAENSPHTNGRQTTIVGQHDGEVGEIPASVTITETIMTQKT